MLIANPIYDSVFKYLMEDTKVAIALISNIIGEKILELVPLPQEQSTLSNKFLLTVYRVDFRAVIQTESGEKKKILIELQKGKDPFDIMRFRHYLGDNYSKSDMISGEKVALPIVTIYFLGFKLSLRKAILKINRIYLDLVSGEVVDEKDDFIEKLSHDSYVIQIPLLPTETKTKVEKVLSVFSQRWIFDDNNQWLMNFPAEIEDEDLKMIAGRLSFATHDEKLQESIRVEQDFDESIERMLRKNEMEIEKREQIIIDKEKVIEGKDKVIEDKEKVIIDKEKVIEDKEKVIEDKEKVIEDKDKVIEELLKQIDKLKNL